MNNNFIKDFNKDVDTNLDKVNSDFKNNINESHNE